MQALEHTVSELTIKHEQSMQALVKEKQWRREAEAKNEEAKNIQIEAQKRFERAEEALDIACGVHAREKEQWKKDTDQEVATAVQSLTTKHTRSIQTLRALRAREKDQWTKETEKRLYEEITTKTQILTKEFETKLEGQKETIKKEVEEQVRKQLVEENEKLKRSLNEEIDMLKKELEAEKTRREGLVTFLTPYRGIFNTGINEYLD